MIALKVACKRMNLLIETGIEDNNAVITRTQINVDWR